MEQKLVLTYALLTALALAAVTTIFLLGYHIGRGAVPLYHFDNGGTVNLTLP